MTPTPIQRLLDQTFEDIGLLIGGLVATEVVEERLVLHLIEGLDGVRRAALRQAIQRKQARPRSRAAPHPAIARFLAKIRAQKRCCSDECKPTGHKAGRPFDDLG
jgi:hypothetical protein